MQMECHDPSDPIGPFRIEPWTYDDGLNAKTTNANKDFRDCNKQHMNALLAPVRLLSSLLRFSAKSNTLPTPCRLHNLQRGIKEKKDSVLSNKSMHQWV